MIIKTQVDQYNNSITKSQPIDNNKIANHSEDFAGALSNVLLNAPETPYSSQEKITQPKLEVPDWVDPAYGYDSKNPRKPNIREMMGAISGKDPDKLYEDNPEEWFRVNRNATELLHGVVGSNEDSRDWSKIMSSSDILTSAREFTQKMHEPKVQIQTEINEDSKLIEQSVVIKNKDGKILRYLSEDPNHVEETLINFGITGEAIPSNLEEQISVEDFDTKLLDLLKNYSGKTIQNLAIETATDALVSKAIRDISLENFI